MVRVEKVEKKMVEYILITINNAVIAGYTHISQWVQIS